jgi:hypothetical protein
MLVSTDLFKIDTEIGQTNDENVIADLQQHIEKYEPEYLEAMFGYSTALLLSGNPDTEPWKSVIEGAVFTGINLEEKWKGLAAAGDSPIVYYVYYWYLRNNSSNSTGGGESIIQKLNSRVVTNRRKQTWAWNRMVDLNWQCVRYMKANSTLFPDWNVYAAISLNNNYHNFFTKINSLNL